MYTRDIIHRIITQLRSYNLRPEDLWGRLSSSCHNVLNIYFKLGEINGPTGVVVLEFGLVEPLFRKEIKREYLPPLPEEILKSISVLGSIPVKELKSALHEDILLVQSEAKKTFYHASIPADFMDSTFPPSNPRVRIVLNTLDYNKFMSDNILQADVSNFRLKYYPKIDVGKLPKNVLINSKDITKDLLEKPRSKWKEIFDFKGYQMCLFVYVLACYYIHVFEHRWADRDEVLELTQSRITLAELRQHFKNNRKENALQRARGYLRKRRYIEKMVETHLNTLTQLGGLRKIERIGRTLYAVSALSLMDKIGQTLWLPAPILLQKIHIENLKTWRPTPPFDINRIPGEPFNRVFIGGPTSRLPTLHIIKSICICNDKQPILTYDFRVPKNGVYKACIHLLLGCQYAIFEVSESSGQLFEIQKALEFGLPILLLYKTDEQDMPVHVSRMLTTLAHSHNVYPEGYSNFEEMKQKIDEFLNPCT